MGKNKSSLSKARSYAAIGEFWDTHDLTEYWDQTKPADFEFDIRSEVTYYALESTLRASTYRGAPTRIGRRVALNERTMYIGWKRYSFRAIDDTDKKLNE